jgi:hypothetical protein
LFNPQWGRQSALAVGNKLTTLPLASRRRDYPPKRATARASGGTEIRLYVV